VVGEGGEFGLTFLQARKRAFSHLAAIGVFWVCGEVDSLLLARGREESSGWPFLKALKRAFSHLAAI